MKGVVMQSSLYSNDSPNTWIGMQTVTTWIVEGSEAQEDLLSAWKIVP